MKNKLLERQLERYLSGTPSIKAFKMIRDERNILAYYKMVGSFYKAKQNSEWEDGGDVSSERI